MKTLKKIATLILFAGLTISAMSQSLVTGSQDFCEGSVYPIKLEDVVGLGLSAGGGSWAEVTPTDNNVVIDANPSNIFLGIDRRPGTYVFVFTPKNNPCLDNDDRAVVTINIYPLPTAVSHLLILCAGSPFDFDLSSLISQEVLDAYTVSYKDESGDALASSIININTEGEFNYSYHISGNGDDVCVDYADISLAVVAIGVADQVDFTEGLSYCAANLPATVNLNQKLGLSAKDGSWSAASGAPTITKGVVALAGASHGNYVYTYNYEDCDGNAKTKDFTIAISEDLSTSFKDVSQDYCKTMSPVMSVDLMDLLGVGFPNSVGTWSEVSVSSPVDVVDGLFEMSDARSGEYIYRFTVSNAVDLCGVSGLYADVTLNIFDNNETLDGEVQLCKANIESGSSIDLAEFMQSLPVNGTWCDLDGTALSGSTADVSALGLGIYSYKYVFDGGPCGEGSVQLLVVVTDMLTNFKDKTKSYCISDDGSDHIDLDQVLALGNVAGTWENTSNVTNFNNSTNVFNGRDEGLGEYIFTFTAAGDGCGISAGDKVVITIKITDDLAL